MNDMPNVMHPISHALSAAGAVALILGLLVACDDFNNRPAADSSTTSQAPQPTPPTRAFGEQADVGSFSYVVRKFFWSNHLSTNEFLDDKPDATFLIVELSVLNQDRQPRTIPPFQLVDENGAIYETTSKAALIKGNLGFFQDLNPGVTTHGAAVFDAPRSHKYRLKVSGGFGSTETSFMSLVEKSETSTTSTPAMPEKPTRSNPAVDEKRSAPVPLAILPIVSGQVTVLLVNGKTVEGTVFKSRPESITIQTAEAALHAVKADEIERMLGNGAVIYERSSK